VSDQTEKPRSTAGGIALLLVGLVILVPSGLCTGLFGGGALLEMVMHPGNGDAIGILPMALIFGGPFVALGGYLVYLGVRKLRGR